VFKIAWSYPINDCERINARTGYEFFEEDGNCIYTIAQWFPRMAAYTDYAGWINKQFLGTGEFTLEFGNYTVRLTCRTIMSWRHGVLQNAEAVLTAKHSASGSGKAKSETKKPCSSSRRTRRRLRRRASRRARRPGSSRRTTCVISPSPLTQIHLGCDGSGGHEAVQHGKPVMAMSLYPKEGMPLWDKYSTHAIAHTIEVYSRYTFDYPYPVAMVGERAGRRHGIPDDLLQRPAP
jgi:hypothetical protein